MSRRDRIEDIYPLAPIQQGLLVESLYAPGGAYQQQLGCRLRGPLDGDVLERAWQRLVDRHAVLRTGFFWKRRKDPFQVVFRRATLPVVRYDWGPADEEDARRRIADLAAEERRRPFDLERPPLARVALVRLASEEHHLVWTYHHLLFDGWCVGQVLEELLATYGAFSRGGEPRLPPRRPYAEFIAWLGGRDPAAAEAFWRRRLEGFRDPTPLGIDLPASIEGAGGHLRRELPREVSERLQELARRERFPVGVLLRGAWGRLLSLYSGRPEVLFGATVVGRPPELPGSEAMVGPFINTLPVRVPVPPDAPLAAWMRDLRDRQAEDGEHEHASLVEIHGWSEVPRGRRLFDSLLLFQNFSRAAATAAPVAREGDDLQELRVEGLVTHEATHYPLTLVATAEPVMAIKAAWDGRRVGREAAVQVLDHLEALLTAAADDPDRPVGEWQPPPFRPPAVVDLPPPPPPVPVQFAQRAAVAPGALAVDYPDGRLEYGRLLERVDRLAHRLHRAGAGPERLVAVSVSRGHRLPLALLAVLRSGAAYLPLDPDWPAERLRLMLEDARPAVLLTDGGAVPAVDPAIEVVRVDASEAAGEATPDASPLLPEVDPEGLAYVIYTSGSTGRPKGTLVRHGGVARHAVEMARLYRLEPGSRILHFFSPSFDASVEDLFPALVSGATVVGVGDPAQLSPRELAAAVRQHGVTHLHLPASHWRRLMEVLEEGDSDLADLRVVAFGGEAVGGETLRRWHRATAGRTVCLNVYGPTETTVTSAACEIEAREQRVLDGPVPIGRPLVGEDLRVVDRDGLPLPAGVPGELLIGGVGVARGYLHRPALTARRFVPMADGVAGSRAYRTGDLVRWAPDGRLVFLGRMDDQVKLRGFRIEPGEVEAALEAHDGVARAAVAVRGDRLVAYVVPRRGESAPGGGELREFLRRRLPAPMVPATFVSLSALPLNTSGKVDRGALPTPPEGAEEPGDGGPRIDGGDPAEEVLGHLWSRILGADRVDRDSDFFALGGHSLLATQAVARINEAFGVELPLRELFEHPTPAALAERVRTFQRRTGPPPPLVARSDGGPRALSFAQRRLWFLDQLEPGSTAYVVAKGVHLEGDLSVPALEDALSEVVRRHQVLRSRFPEQDGEPVQEVAAPRPVLLPRVDLRRVAAGPEPADRLASRAVSAAGSRPFDLAAGPLLRLRLLVLGPRHHALVLSLHHSVADGLSIDLLLSELRTLYAAFRDGRPSPLEELPVQYADYAEWQRQWLQGQVLEEQLDYWRQRLGGTLPVLELGPRRTPGQRPGNRGGHLDRPLPQDLVERLRRFAAAEGATPFMVLLAAFQALLARLTGQQDVVVGADVAGRTRRETERLVGFFINMLVLRTRVDGDQSFRRLVGRVRETALGAYAHQELPFDRLVEEVQPRRDGSHSPIFQVVFNYESRLAREESESGLDTGLRLRPVEGGERPVRFDLTLGVADSGGGLRSSWTYRTDLFAAEDVEHLHERYRVLLDSALADPDRDVGSLELLGDAERERQRQAQQERRSAARNRLRKVRPTSVTVESKDRTGGETPDGPTTDKQGRAMVRETEVKP